MDMMDLLERPSEHVPDQSSLRKIIEQVGRESLSHDPELFPRLWKSPNNSVLASKVSTNIGARWKQSSDKKPVIFWVSNCTLRAPNHATKGGFLEREKVHVVLCDRIASAGGCAVGDG